MSEQKERRSGFFWVKHKEHGWVVAQWCIYPKAWYLPAEYYGMNDHDLLEIDERRIVREEPKHPNYTGLSGNTERIPQNE